MRLLCPLALAGLSLLLACETAPPITVPQAPRAQVAQLPQGPPPKPRIALVLGGGAARGFAHVGVIRALEQEKIPIDMVVDISANIGNTNITNLLGVTLQATNIMFALNVEHAKREADILITPAGIGDVGMLDFTQKKRCMQAGIQATQAALPNIHKVLDAWVTAHTRPALPMP